MYGIRFTTFANNDVAEIYADYERRQEGLGERFLLALGKVLSMLEFNPLLYGVVDLGIRAALIRRFPQLVFYRTTNTEVIIFAVRHGREHHAVWQNRRFDN